MTLKPDEEFVKDWLVKALNAINAIEGEDPPDIYLDVNNERIAVEITRLSPVSFAKDGKVQNRNSQDYFGINICDDLDSSMRNEMSFDTDIFLTLYVPVENARKYKKQLKNYIRNYISNEIKAGDREEIEISGSRVGISVIPSVNADKKITGAIVNTNSSAHILNNAQVTLAERILDKVNKCKDIKHKGPVWLALFNDYWLADEETYAQALRTTSIIHSFERIYLVMDTGAVHQIF